MGWCLRTNDGMHYMEFGRVQMNAKYSDGLWEQFANTFATSDVLQKQMPATDSVPN